MSKLAHPGASRTVSPARARSDGPLGRPLPAMPALRWRAAGPKIRTSSSEPPHRCAMTARTRESIAGHRRQVDALAEAAGDQHDPDSNERCRRERSVGIGGLRVVDPRPRHPTPRPDGADGRPAGTPQSAFLIPASVAPRCRASTAAITTSSRKRRPQAGRRDAHLVDMDPSGLDTGSAVRDSVSPETGTCRALTAAVPAAAAASGSSAPNAIRSPVFQVCRNPSSWLRRTPAVLPCQSRWSVAMFRMPAAAG